MTPAATDTLREDFFPSIGIITISSQIESIFSSTPFTSFPTTIQTFSKFLF